MELLFLGTGSSAGVPVIGCNCSVCTSSDPRNKRLRPSALLTIEGKSLLIDSGPDFRSQALQYNIQHLDGVIITHSHFDHIAGLDELRTFYIRQKRSTPLLVSEATWQDLKRRYDYLFHEKAQGKSLAAQLDFQILKEGRGSAEFVGVPLQYMSYEQGGMHVMGLRFGSLAYVTDIRIYPETIFEDLRGVEILILSTIGPRSSTMHFSIDEAVSFAKKVGALRTYLMHISHIIDHATISATLPEGVYLAYDGLQI